MFDTSQWAITYSVDGRTVDLTAVVCETKRALSARNAGGVVVVGRHDRRILRGTPAAELHSNAALAQQRAETVAKYLSEANDCGGPVGPVIRVIAAPVILGRGQASAEALAADRSVEVYGLVAE